MRPALMNLQVGLSHLLIWIAIVGILVAGYFFFRRWRQRHPKRATREGSYSQRLGHRLAQGRKGQKGRGAAQSTERDRPRG